MRKSKMNYFPVLFVLCLTYSDCYYIPKNIFSLEKTSKTVSPLLTGHALQPSNHFFALWMLSGTLTSSLYCESLETVFKVRLHQYYGRNHLFWLAICAFHWHLITGLASMADRATDRREYLEGKWDSYSYSSLKDFASKVTLLI